MNHVACLGRVYGKRFRYAWIKPWQRRAWERRSVRWVDRHLEIEVCQ